MTNIDIGTMEEDITIFFFCLRTSLSSVHTIREDFRERCVAIEVLPNSVVVFPFGKLIPKL